MRIKRCFKLLLAPAILLGFSDLAAAAPPLLVTPAMNTEMNTGVACAVSGNGLVADREVRIRIMEAGGPVTVLDVTRTLNAPNDNDFAMYISTGNFTFNCIVEPVLKLGGTKRLRASINEVATAGISEGTSLNAVAAPK